MNLKIKKIIAREGLIFLSIIGIGIITLLIGNAPDFFRGDAPRIFYPFFDISIGIGIIFYILDTLYIY